MAYIPPDNLAYPLLLELPNGGSGSGFFLASGQEHFLVTAKHVLYDEKGNLRSPTLKLSCQSKLAGEPATQYLIDFSKVPVRAHTSADVAVIRMGVSSPIDGKTEALLVNHCVGIRVLNVSPAGVVTVDSANLRLLDEATIGNDVLLYGYPTSLGLKNSPQFDYDKPLLRKGVLAAISKVRGTIVLDCPAYPGNSGGPVVEVEEQGFRKFHRIVGVVSQFVPQLHQRYSPYTGKPIEPEMFNSGYSIAVAMDKVLELLTATPEMTAPVVTSNTVEKLSAERLSAMTAAERKAAQAQAEIACSLDNPDACEMCSG